MTKVMEFSMNSKKDPEQTFIIFAKVFLFIIIAATIAIFREVLKGRF